MQAKAAKELYDARQKRPRPHVDDKIITAWNGLVISGLAKASVALYKVAKDTCLFPAGMLKKSFFLKKKENGAFF